MSKKRLICTFVTFIFLLQAGIASIMEVPRRVSVLKTKYFDILFSEKSKNTAYFLSQEADRIYENAMQVLEIERTFRMPIVISPDSEVLEISYSPIPYNRIIIYEGVPAENQSIYENTFLSLFYKQVLLAVNESIRSPFVQKIMDVVNIDSFQPVALVNLPFSFLEGFANVITGKMEDEFFLQILSQAKIEGEFPTWFQAIARRDTEPNNKLALAAGSAFMAFIQQKWGFEKYAELWEECAKLQFLLTPGIFYKVYGVKLEEIWEDFEDSIPLPENLSQIYESEVFATEFFYSDTESRYSSILSTEYGFVWYDDIRHEVDILDPNIPIKVRQLLFLADSIDRLTLSPDGRFISVSYTGYQNRKNFKQKFTRIYDLKRRCYISGKYNLRDGTIVLLSDGEYGIAGINVQTDYPVFQVYRLGELNNLIYKEKRNTEKTSKNELVFEKKYKLDSIPYSPVYAGKGKVDFIVKKADSCSVCQIDIESGKEKCWTMNNIRISNLSYGNTMQKWNTGGRIPEEIYTFEYVPSDKTAFTRMGYFELNESFEPVAGYLQDCELGGGVYSPVVKNNNLYYSSHNLYYDKLICYPLDKIDFEQIQVTQIDTVTKVYKSEDEVDINSFETKKYRPINYRKIGAIYPMMPAKSLDLETGVKLWPGIGLSFENQTDPLDNTLLVFSAAYALAKLDYSTLKNPSTDEILDMEVEELTSNTDYSFIGYIKNSSLPFDLSAGSTFRFNNSGFYDFRCMAGMAIDIPCGMTFRNLRLNLQAEKAYSTKYYDKVQESIFPDKEGWVNLSDSYNFFEISLSAEYTNYTQYGISPFEMRGFKIKSKVYSLWDSEKKENYLNSSFYTTVGIPRLTPFQMHNGWILSAPAIISADFMGKNGSALETCAEVLLIGREIQNGWPLLYLYFNRFGLKFGYDLSLNYDIEKVSLPDLRQIAQFINIFENTHIFDSVFIKFNLDFIPPIGRLSSGIIKSESKFSYYPRSKGFKITLNIDVEM